MPEESVLKHMTRAVSDAEVQTSPFPHVVVSGLFPSSLYGQILECLPDPGLYEPFGYDRNAADAGGSSRARFRLVEDTLSRLPAGQQHLWRSIRDLFGSTWLKEIVYEKLSHGLAKRFGCNATEARFLPGFPLPELFRETTGYRIKPHPDSREKVVTMQVCLSGDESLAALGTEFYRLSLSPRAWLREPRGFEVVKRMPFIPNSAYAFPVLNTLATRSWHGRSTLPPTAGIRNSLLNFWYRTPDRANKELLRVPDARPATT